MSGSTSRFGCLGCSWLGAMVLGTAVLSGTLVWIAPQWLQPLLFWQEPPLPPEVILIPAELMGDEFDPEPAVNPEAEVELWDAFAVTGDYTENGGLELTTIGGSKWRFPPGAISGDRPVTVTPVGRIPPTMVLDGAVPVGQVFHLEVDGEEHWTFDRPIEMTIPFDGGLLGAAAKDVEPTIAVWEGDHWQALPTGHDRTRGVLTSRAPHASIIGTIWAVSKGVGLGWAILTSEPAQAIWQQIKSETDKTYSTKNFNLNYLSAGKTGAPPTDAVYLEHTSHRGKKHAGHPLYITDLGAFFEEGRAWLPDVKMKVAEVWVDRYEVYVIPLPDFGASKLGGPMIITSDMKVNGALLPDLAYDMRRTCVHELIHVAQDDSLSNLQDFALDLRWWIEATAEHLSVELMRTRGGQPSPKPYFYTARSPYLPAVGLDGSTALQPYAYARLFEWIAGKEVNMVDVIQAVNGRWVINEKALDEEIRNLALILGLPDYHASFAKEYYHANAWTGSMTGLQKAGHVFSVQSTRFTRITTLSRGSYVVKFYDETQIEETAVVSKLYPFRASNLPAQRETRLVVQVEAPQGADETSISVAEQRGNPPFSGKPGPTTGPYARPIATVMSSARMAAPLVNATDIDRMTVIVNHGSFASGDAPITVRRWLLMAPAWVTSFRQQDGRYDVTWHPAEIKKAGDGKAFKGYHVYRRAFGHTEFPTEPINKEPLTDEFFVDTPPSDGFWEYTVRVRDIADNLGEPAPIDADGDPFVGTWDGKLKLLDGSIAELATRLIRSEVAKAGVGDDQTGLDAMIASIRGVLSGIDLLFKVGVPMTFEVRADRGHYKLRVTKALSRPVDDGEELVLDRLGRSTIGALPTTPQGEAVLLSLSAKDQIYREYYGTIENDPDVGTMRFGLKVAFKRTSSKPPPPRP